MNIGFLQPYSFLTVDASTLLKQFAKDGHKVIFITLTPKDRIHPALENENIIFEFIGDGKSERVYRMLPKAIDVIKICKKYDLDILYNNFSTSQLIGLIAEPFCKTKMVYLRHHSTDAAQAYGNWKGSFIDKILNKLSSKTIVPSQLVKNDVIKEGVNPKNVVLIPYCYDFASYPEVDETEIRQIRKRFNDKRILLMISRYVPQKRYELAVKIAKKLKDSGVKDFVFLCLGDGHLKEDIEKLVVDSNLQDIFFLEGFKENVITYIAACELLVHTSASEASCHAVKEAGWMRKNIICCENVGDFSDYLINGENAFVVNKNYPVQPMYEIIKSFLEGEVNDKEIIAERLHQIILMRFTPEAAVVKHYELINSMLAV